MFPFKTCQPSSIFNTQLKDECSLSAVLSHPFQGDSLIWGLKKKHCVTISNGSGLYMSDVREKYFQRHKFVKAEKSESKQEEMEKFHLSQEC